MHPQPLRPGRLAPLALLLLVALALCARPLAVPVAHAAGPAPQTTVDDGPSGPVNGTFTLQVSSDHAPSDFDCSYDGGPWRTCDEGRVLPDAATAELRVYLDRFDADLAEVDEDHEVRVRAVDPGDGTVDPTPASFTVRVDTLAPRPTVIATGVETGEWAAKAWSSGGVVDRASCDADPSRCVVPERDVNTSYYFTNDKMPSSATFRLTSDDPAARWVCRFDDGPSTPCADGVTYDFLTPGRHSFRAQAIDNATPYCRQTWTIASETHGGELCPTNPAYAAAGQLPGNGRTKTVSWDTLSPRHTTITDGPGTGGVRVTADATPTWAVSTDTSQASPDILPLRYECAVARNYNGQDIIDAGLADDAGWYACDPNAAQGPLPDGSHVFFVRSEPASGPYTPNDDIDFVQFAVDTRIDTTFVEGPDGDTEDTTPTFAYTAPTELTGGRLPESTTFECRVDGAAWFACGAGGGVTTSAGSVPPRFTTPTLSPGPHTVEARATDAVGNVDATPALRRFTVVAPPVTPPVVPPVDPPTDPPTVTVPPTVTTPPPTVTVPPPTTTVPPPVTTPKKLGPIAVARATRTAGTDAGFRIDGSRSRDRDGGRIVRWQWTDLRTGKAVSRSRSFPFTATDLGARARDFRWRLTVWDNDGLSDSSTVTVHASKKIKRTTIRLSGDALFYFDSDRLRPVGLRELRKIRQRVQGAESYAVGAHASAEGTDAYNLALSDRRARAMVAYIQRGNSRAPRRHSATGYGERRPVASNATEAGRRKNRRAEITIAKVTVTYTTDVEAGTGPARGR